MLQSTMTKIDGGAELSLDDRTERVSNVVKECRNFRHHETLSAHGSLCCPPTHQLCSSPGVSPGSDRDDDVRGPGFGNPGSRNWNPPRLHTTTLARAHDA